MKKLRFILVNCFILSSIHLCAQTIKLNIKNIAATNVSVSTVVLMGKEALKVVKDSTIQEIDEPTFAKVKEIGFTNGTIEVNVLSKLLPNAQPMFQRGFIGVAFRINNDNSKFECIYIRPANGRENDQVRRNHAVQYISFPDYKFDKLRKETPGKYESYADMGLNEWIKLKIVVKDAQAKIYINGNKQSSLIVNDLKQGAGSAGAIGLWVDAGTEGFFSDLKIIK